MLDLNWLLGLFGSSAKKVDISVHSNILVSIVIGVVLLYLYRSGESGELNSNYINEVDEGESEEYPVDEPDRDFDWDQQHHHRTSEHGVPCAFCGDQSTTRCASCKVARYCSVECQIGHWRSWHKYECFKIETEEGEAREIHGHQNPMLDENYDNGISNGVELSSNVGIMDASNISDVNNSHVGCEQCGSPSTTSCPRCNAVRYCSTMCLITNWKWHKYNCIPGEGSSSPTERPNRNEEEENIHSSTPLYLELYPEGTSNSMSLTKVSQLSALRNENESISNAEKKAYNVIQSLQLQIAAQENIAEIAEKRRLEEHIQMLESECAMLKKELEEEHKHVQYLTLEYNKSHETTQIAIREVEAIKQELLEEREHVQGVKENLIRDVTIAKSRAIFAEAKLSDLQRKIKLTDYKIVVKTDSLGKPSRVKLY
ncbi:hypothetical protein TSUD_364140 [Trifolium subterraneum]|uniref:MYND-type domain-containing protein n=1 Tax=Trifolium subterraneum TaxID=3900 RepID=A0A2Z6MSP4_TRISU|nr:hypothetical protein TSUD_364140 [Trifolium subterraneum]